MPTPFSKIDDDRLKNDRLTAGFHDANFPQLYAIVSDNGLSVRESLIFL
jgi:hypothetical protein